MEKLRMAACGIDCNECNLYKITMEQDIKAAESVVGWFKSRGWIGEDEGAEAVMNKNPLCTGCWNITDDCFWKCGCHNIDFRICCNERQINHCGECSDFPCEDYSAFAVGHEKAMERLLSIRGNIK